MRFAKYNLLRRKLATVDAWITGQRQDQSVTRAALPQEQTDTAFLNARSLGHQVQSALQLEFGGRVGLHPRIRRALQHATRPRLSVHRLRAVHSPHRTASA